MIATGDPAIARARAALASARAAAGLARTRRIARVDRRARASSIDGRDAARVRQQRLPGTRQRPGRRRRRARRGATLGRRCRRVASGRAATASPHEALERELAAFVAPCAGARALTFSSGYLANLAILTALAARSDAIFADRLNHACLNDGALLSRAQARPLSARRRRGAAQRGSARRSARASSSPPTPCSAWTATSRRCPSCSSSPTRTTRGWSSTTRTASACWASGRGSLAHFGLASERIVYMGTLGKAAGVAGAFVAAHPAVIETLLQTRAVVHLHDGGAAAARRGAAGVASR